MSPKEGDRDKAEAQARAKQNTKKTKKEQTE